MVHHGAMDIRGINPPRSKHHEEGRFGRLFPGLPPFAADTAEIRQKLLELGRKGGLMDPGADANNNPANPSGLPAGFTFLGQFIDHDLTFDPTSSLERQNDPEAISNFRTPALELDNVYGAGPGGSPFLYDASNRAKFLIDAAAPKDLPRNSQLVALIGDPRNDENLIVSQLHLAFLKFHNAVVDQLLSEGKVPQGQLFEEAQRLVRWHYQWIVVNEFLPHIVGEALVKELLAKHRQDRWFHWKNEPFIPVEFAVAAYRFGHSQIRAGYRVNADFAAPIFSPALPLDAVDPNDLRGGKRAPRRFVDWRFFFQMDSTAPQLSLRIDSTMSPTLFELPFIPAGAPVTNPQSLAQRNLLRGLTFGLPSGQAMARALRIRPLSQEDLADLVPLGLAESTPPWFYILREAQQRAEGRTLGPLGGRIVAEVFLGLLEGDALSYLSAAPDWQPVFGKNGQFTIADMLKFAGVA